MKGVFLIATAESEDSIHPRLNAAHIFMEKVKLGAPDRQARRDVRSGHNVAVADNRS